ncbi:MurR/RpiR family transcriptional regulator [Psychromicrobium xiongbiense]|uniref:MurR/RpiR family transcriptional regulator n=1 Tax=Psychromicrobium xiongbiense TaxID=3051184 RepID=UPI0025557BB3|nr:MurR/RpiR family transcriptional regulator [Psychromicrobium sp. YIM S02556]
MTNGSEPESPGQTPERDARTILVRIRAAVPSLRPSEQRIAQLLLDNPAGNANLSVAELAARCSTSTTSVVRFYQRMGYAHYKDLRLDLTREATREHLASPVDAPVTGDIDRNDTLDEVIAKIAHNETVSLVDTAKVLDREALARAIELIGRSRRLDCFGVGASSFVGLDLQQKLIRIGRTALHWPDAHSARTSAATLDADCVALGISHSGTTADVIEFLEVARQAGAATIALTNFDSSPLAQAADIVLTTAARESGFRSGAFGSRIAQLMVVDCLLVGVAQANYENTMSALWSTYVAVHHHTPDTSGKASS